MKIYLKYFSIYRQRFQKDECVKEYPENSSVKEIFFSHFDQFSEAEKLFHFTRFAVNADYCSSEMILKEGDELVFIPPVSGG